MDVYGRIEQLLKEKGISAYRLSKETGISTGLLTQWKKRTQKPSLDKLQIVADYFGVSVDYFLTGVEPNKNAPVLNQNQGDELEEILEEVRRNPDLRMLFSLSSKATPEELKKYIRIIKAMCGDDDGANNR